MKLSKLQYIVPILRKVGEQKIPIKTAYKFIKLNNLIEPELEFYSTRLNAIIQNYGAKDEEGNLIQENGNFKLQNDHINDCQNEFNELNSIEVDIPINFTLDELEKVDLSVGELSLLESLIKEE